METNVTVVAPDKIILINGIGFIVDHNYPNDLHAIQWHNNSGHIEYNDGSPNVKITQDDYEKIVKPYVDLWYIEKEKEDKKKNLELESYNSIEGRFERLRLKRDEKIRSTDYLILPDYPISEENKQYILKYRQNLRDLPSLEGAPWDGGENQTPWPDYPKLN